MQYFKMVKLTLALPTISLLLVIYSFAGAITFPSFLDQFGGLDRYLIELILLLVTALILTLVGRAIGVGVFVLGTKYFLEAHLLAYVGVFVVGGMLALMTLLNAPFSMHLNLAWRVGSWYGPWLTMFILSAPIMLVTMV